ncbi:MAG: non-hydrolyzing UDP-N-acetylglucosamine 2-epimerase [Candidatus Odinarchaeota archaeon]
MLISIIGTRPHLVKLASIVRAVSNKKIEHFIIHTGQHYDYELSQVFFEDLQIPKPNEFLKVGSGHSSYQIGETIIRTAKILRNLDASGVVLVFGDTNATVGAAIGAKKADFITAHIESGVRTNDFRLPEEINRQLAEVCSEILFTPTKQAFENVRTTGRAFNVGDVMYDTLLWAKPKLNENMLNKLQLSSNEFILLTLHRNINVDNLTILENLIENIAVTGEQFIFPAHPRTKRKLNRIEVPKNIMVISPLGYLDFLSLMQNSRKVVTDSGGIQKEAYMLGKPCVTLLEARVWPETIKAGWNFAAGRDPDKILTGIREFWPRKKRPKIFGDGNTAKRIIEILLEHFPRQLKEEYEHK